MVKSTPADASPTKRFFVEMLTRDIELADAVLDLLDNCLDGIVRQTEPDGSEPTPYKKFWAKIDFKKGSFSISDNCGGIDRELAERVAFRLGRPKAGEPEKELATVGVYGIGMKRAIFKLGRSAKVTSRTKDDAFEVAIKDSWLESDDDWDLPIKTVAKEGNTRGTTIEVTKLYDVIGTQFGDKQFVDDFIRRVATHYSFIIHKGFKVTVNDELVTPTPVKFLLSLEKGSKKGVAPFLYEATFDEVEIHLAIGFIKPIPTNDEIDEEQNAKHSRDEAGWTVICNDRVVLYCDKSRLTGWGDASVPAFHAQFMGIAGIIEFRSTNALKLPVTTTKRGIDAGSEVYLFAKNTMREGMKIFTNYTYKLKDRPPDEREQVRAAPAVELHNVRSQLPQTGWTKILKNKLEKERKFVPELPAPAPSASDEKFMRFAKPVTQIRRVSAFLFGGDREQAPSEVGSKAFDWVHEKAKS